jgi:hypothetical protein
MTGEFYRCPSELVSFSATVSRGATDSSTAKISTSRFVSGRGRL